MFISQVYKAFTYGLGEQFIEHLSNMQESLKKTEIQKVLKYYLRKLKKPKN